jgi:hypothetical protein
MTKPVIVTRLGKGSELTFGEGDANFTNLQNATVSVVGDSGTTQVLDLNDTLTVAGGTGLSSVMTTDTVTLNLDNTAVTPNSYTYASITVDQQGRITSASSGTAPLVSGGALGTPSSGTLTNCTFPTLNQNTTGSAATLTTPRAINGVNFDGSAAITVTADAGTLSGSTLASGVTASSLTSLGTIATGIWNGSSISTTYTDAKVTSVNGSTGAVTGLATTASLSSYQATSEKNQNNGYAGLDAGGKVASAQLPSYVDDVVEAANYAALPATGETSKIYVTLDTNKTYRWSGSAYVEIAASPGTTDSLTEGSTNLYFTNTRADGRIAAANINDLNDVNTTGVANNHVLKYNSSATQWQSSLLDIPTTLDSLTDVNTTGVSNNHVLKYNSGASEWQSSLLDLVTTLDSLTDVSTAGASNEQLLSYNSSTSSWSPRTVTAGISSVSSDATPMLGGNLTVNGNSIISASNGNIVLAPNGTGKTRVNAINYNEGAIYTVTYGATITPDVTNGNTQQVTLTGNVTFSAFTTPVAGQSLTLIVKQDATGSRTLTSTMKFAGGTKTLTTAANSVDIISVYYDGTTYWASLGKDFK